MELPSALFKPKLEKIKKTLRKKFLIFREKKLSSCNIKKFLIFSQKKTFFIFQETETLEKFLIFQKTELLHISGGTSKAPKTKISYISLKKVMKKIL